MALKKNVSGQYLYFCLVSTASGLPVAGASGVISGRKSLDGLSGMIVLSGNIIELGGGSYRANLYDHDTNGDCAGYLFTASGCAPVQYSMVTQGGMSGSFHLGSGAYAVDIPQGVLAADFSGMDCSGSRNLLNAARKLVNRFDLSAFSGRLAVYKEDDTTLAFTQDVTGQSGAVPIVQLRR